jgi:hypothetical protein
MATPSAFRRGNDAIARSAERAGFTEGAINFLCECVDENCFEAVPLELEEYQRLRGAGPVVAAVHLVGAEGRS